MIVELTKQIFSEHGIPAIVRSDNGPHFQGHYKTFAEDFGFEHITSSPHYPRSNGFIESQVKIVKKIFQKARKSKVDPHMALLCLRSTPIDSQLSSPAELLFGRQIQDNLPRRDLEQAKISPFRDVFSRLQERQTKQKYYYDRSTKSLPSLCQRQNVMVQNPRSLEWEPAEIESEIEKAPRSYNVSIPDGRELRRNRSQIRERSCKRVRINPSPESPKEIKPQSTQEIDSPAAVQRSELAKSANDHYTTRSGRIVKPPQRLNL
ncbi:uncharacterized protein K02A2.6-like [Dendronephthya gigantea]|uniref:uncharacterized protein K02A2.6-like n=1 Tax=Dendronephthya gigantea TaxID=151771 RepID=UPI001069B909|nr:uncharacterized protein K02A2.6-like [Dendronephthya gigantea]